MKNKCLGTFDCKGCAHTKGLDRASPERISTGILKEPVSVLYFDDGSIRCLMLEEGNCLAYKNHHSVPPGFAASILKRDITCNYLATVSKRVEDEVSNSK